ncbi:MAG: hypothetical protein CVU48_04130 [Candidatus Cloacimonetes bacterium HGW-Cloacimonetes-1]|jgi:hypothetical protein|nr:MAG: hypothetical protein CVU48_04130 [Candidatus Cloacimonetes bacterium HGW-Cloacimonetes-1]
MILDALSIIYRATKLFASMDNEQTSKEMAILKELNDKLYGGIRIPFVFDDQFPISLHLLSPRLRNLLDSNEYDSQRLWSFLSSRENIIRMITATEMEKPAAEAMSYRLVAFYPARPKDIEGFIQFKQIIGYMIKIIMELHGYIVEQKRVKISSHLNPDTQKALKYFTTASRYRKLTNRDLDDFVNDISDPAEKEMFKHIMMRIRTGQTQYQKLYALDKLTSVYEL